MYRFKTQEISSHCTVHSYFYTKQCKETGYTTSGQSRTKPQGDDYDDVNDVHDVDVDDVTSDDDDDDGNGNGNGDDKDYDNYYGESFFIESIFETESYLINY